MLSMMHVRITSTKGRRLKVEEEPHFNHLDVRGDWQASNNRDEHAGKDQHHG